MATLTKEQVKRYAALHSRKARLAEGLFIAEGFKVCEELAESEFNVECVVVRNGTAIPDSLRKFQTFEVDAKAMDRLSAMDSPPGIICIARIPNQTHRPKETGITLFLDGVSDPGNVGTIIRLAEWFGAVEVLLSPDSADPYSPKVVQSAMGSLFRVQVNIGKYDVTLNRFRSRGLPALASVLDGNDIHMFNRISDGILVIGSESHGIRPEVQALCTDSVTIAKVDGAMTESLNAATATAILLFHLSDR
jgi:TrmH family RNA methyltransferase